MALAPYLEGAESLLDIGSGGGFPGLPLGIVRPDMKVTLTDRNVKKCAFLSHVVMTLKLPNIEVKRLSIPGDSAQLEKFDAITARAVATPVKVWRWSKALLASKGKLYLQSAGALDSKLFAGGEVSSWPSTGIGWINCIERA